VRATSEAAAILVIAIACALATPRGDSLASPPDTAPSRAPVVLDLRAEASPGAILLHAEGFEREIGPIARFLPLDGPIAVLGDDVPSREVVHKLLQLGYRNVRAGRRW
jgi:hypothetical protein